MSNEYMNGQTPPQDLDGEKAVLGAVLLDNEKLAETQEFITSDDFYRHAHQLIFAAM